jgi:hypothetical protein
MSLPLRDNVQTGATLQIAATNADTANALLARFETWVQRFRLDASGRKTKHSTLTSRSQSRQGSCSSDCTPQDGCL